MWTEQRIIRYDDLPAYLRDGWRVYATQTGDGRFVTVWRVVAQTERA